MTRPDAPVLTLNAGSSSLKFAVFQPAKKGREPVEILGGQISAIGAGSSFTCRIAGETEENGAPKVAAAGTIATHEQALEHVLAFLQSRQITLAQLAGAGHRVVHGGARFTAPVRVDAPVLEVLDKLAPLAPHHMPHNLEAIRALAALAPDLPQIACFDTAFHAAQGEIETRLPLPGKWFDRGLRRYGFHGLNYDHVVKTLPGVMSAPLPKRLVILHLGNGASICAVKDGACVGTSMGFSTLDGLIMATRCGSIDPGVLLHLQKAEGLDVEQLEDLLYNRSGLLGLSGTSGNMQVLLAEDSDEARFAVNKYCHAAARHVGSLLPLLGGLDALVFTGGIGENAAPVREKIAAHLACFGVQLDERANRAHGPEITAPGASPSLWIVPANEEETIARQVFALIRAS